MLLACVGVIGLWGIGFSPVDLQRLVFEKHFIAEGSMTPASKPEEALGGHRLADDEPRGEDCRGCSPTATSARRSGSAPRSPSPWSPPSRPARCSSTLTKFHQVFWMVPLMSFFQLALFVSYAIYFRNSSRKRTCAAASLCYNVEYFVAAFGPTIFGLLTKFVFSEERGYHEALRPLRMSAAVFHCSAVVGQNHSPRPRTDPLME
ncbi:MAG: hypothetical protein R3F11_17845 [Verrucomicrobiales bacterium]